MLFSTYNIHYGVGADGKYDVARIADAVAEADIVCLQEAVNGWPQNGHAAALQLSNSCTSTAETIIFAPQSLQKRF